MGLGTGGSMVLGTGLDIATNAVGMGMQQSQQSHFAEEQLKNQQRMGRFNKDMALQMWKDTNYSAQRAEMEKAGLNVGMMYSGTGSSGTTANVPSGTATAGNAEMPKNGTGMGMLLQAEAIESQVEVNKAQAENIQASTNEIKARTPIHAQNIISAELANELASNTLATNIDKAGAEYNKLVAEFRGQHLNNELSAETLQEKIKLVDIEVISKTLENELTKAKINLTNEEKRAISEELAQGWERLYIGLKEIDTKKHQNAINEFTAKINAKLGYKNLEMRRIEAALNTAGNVIKGRSKTEINHNGDKNTTIQNY